MAGAEGSDNPARNDVMQLRAFQELFKGRFDTEESAFLLTKFDGDSKAAVSFVISVESDEIRKLIENEKDSWTTVKSSKSQRKKLANKLERIKASHSILQDAKLGRINTSARLYGCGQCDNYWWRRTPERKQVSKCHRCGVRFDPVPRDKEWGWALFKCANCQNEFGGFCGMWMTSPCYLCRNQVRPYCIQPPTKDRTRRTTNTHKCNAPDCNCLQKNPAIQRGGSGRHQIQVSPQWNSGFEDGDLRNTDPGSEADYTLLEVVEETELPLTCVHPSSRRAQKLPLVIVASQPHDSTGSTIDSFLPQGDLCQKYETVFLPLETIHERDD